MAPRSSSGVSTPDASISHVSRLSAECSGYSRLPSPVAVLQNSVLGRTSSELRAARVRAPCCTASLGLP
eukprot:13081741-Alexandrium_andersonii.AAC.1